MIANAIRVNVCVCIVQLIGVDALLTLQPQSEANAWDTLAGLGTQLRMH